MSKEIIILLTTAATIGFTHTLIGPDHYLPFIVLSKARKWSALKTSSVTFLCGLGHVLSSIILGFIGIFLGVAIFKLEAIEASRGDIAAWLLIAFGLAYFIWGIRWAVRSHPHAHRHVHQAGDTHEHLHQHTDHPHLHSSKNVNVTPWVLFLIFVFGPCEPLIPLVIYPAIKHNMPAVVLVSFVFGLATILTMLVIVLGGYYGLSKLPMRQLEKYSHALAGLAILLCGVAVKFLGL